MIINGINFPNELINDLKEDRLVVFAGAGISMGEPTCLPDFIQLANTIALGTGKKIDDSIPCEAFLGNLKACGIPVNDLAAEVLNKRCLKPNSFHKAILDLFESNNKIRVVTTNYDKMLEKTLLKKGVKVYNSPALPLGDDIQGIIHIHGIVDNPEYMVLTDEDFGKAYLTEGYVSRFLVKLFETYTILFVGYSYNDVITRYLTRAMTANTNKKRYILTYEDNPTFEALGIEPIIFPNERYDIELDALIKLGNRIRRGLNDWNTMFGSLNDVVPTNDDEDSEIIYCLEDIDKCRLLLDNIHNPEFIDYFDRKKVLDCCFETATSNYKYIDLWGKWLCNNFLSSSEYLLDLFASHKNTFNREFATIILKSLINKFDDLTEEQIGLYFTLIKDKINNVWQIQALFKLCIEKRYTRITFAIFKKLFSYEIVIESRKWGTYKSTELRHFNRNDYYCIKSIWDEYSDVLVELFPKDLVLFSIVMIENLHDDYVICGETKTERDDPYSIDMISIESNNKELKYTTKDSIYILCDVIEKCFFNFKEQYYLKILMKVMVDSNSSLLRRLALKIIRKSSLYSDDEKIDFLLTNYELNNLSCKEQIFLLVKHSFLNASEDFKEKLIYAIEKSAKDDSSQDIRDYYLFNWTVWILTIEPNNKRMQELQRHILLNNPNFKPRKHPELDVEFSSGGWDMSSPITSDNMIKMEPLDLVGYLKSYNKDGFDGPSREGFLKAFSESVCDNYEWAIQFASVLVEQEVREKDVWMHYFWGINNSKLSALEYLKGITFFQKYYTKIPDYLGLSRFLLKSIECEDFVDCFDDNKALIFDFSKKILDSRNEDNDFTGCRVIDLTLNTTFGVIISCWSLMCIKFEKAYLSDEYKNCFFEALNKSGWEKKVAICLLAGRYNYFAYKDLEWSNEVLKPYFLSDNREIFSAAWEGVAYFSSRINPDFVDELLPVYLYATNKITWIENTDARYSFINRLLTIFIFVEKNPCEEFIPLLYQNNDRYIIQTFIREIGNRYKNYEIDVRDNWWNSWLRQFIVNRIQNKPACINDDEFSEILSLIIDLTDRFEDMVSILCGEKYYPHKIDGQIWYDLASICEELNKSESFYKLICFLLKINSDIFLYMSSVIKCINSLLNLTVDEKRILKDLLLKNDITISDINI